MKQSNFLSLGLRDALRGILIAVLTPVFVVIQESLELGALTFNFKAMGVAALAGALAYLTKNIFTKPDVRSFGDIGIPKPPNGTKGDIGIPIPPK